MADVKTIIIETPSLSAEGGPGARELLGGGAALPRAGDGGWPGAPLDDPGAHVAAGPDDALERLRSGRELTRLRLEGPDFDGPLAAVLEAADRRTVLAVVTDDQVIFYGYGIDPAAETAGLGSAAWRDVLPTLAMIGEFYLAKGVEGRVIFGVLRNPSLKQTQIDKLKAALGRLETMLKRGSREPWDKHDCA
jgi:hypothetical protein